MSRRQSPREYQRKVNASASANAAVAAAHPPAPEPAAPVLVLVRLSAIADRSWHLGAGIAAVTLCGAATPFPPLIGSPIPYTPDRPEGICTWCQKTAANNFSNTWYGGTAA